MFYARTPGGPNQIPTPQKSNSSAGVILLPEYFFKECPYQAPLLVCLPTPVYILYLFTYRSRPVQATKSRRLLAYERVLLYQTSEK